MTIYIFDFGTGKNWLQNDVGPIKFRLEDEKRTYIAIVTTKKAITIYKNGVIINSVVKNSSVKIANSDTPLIIGNWIGWNRPFNGLIEEIRITNGSIDDEIPVIQKSLRILQNNSTTISV